jgi:hypothetical protein
MQHTFQANGDPCSLLRTSTVSFLCCHVATYQDIREFVTRTPSFASTTATIPAMTDYGVRASCTRMPPYVMSQVQTVSQAISLPISPRPKHFLVRPSTNIIAPLIALDELPQFISLHGVPRSMSLRDTVWMTRLGNVGGEGGIVT